MTNTVATLSGMFKEVYAEQIERLPPAGVRIYKDARFVSKDKQNGNQYHQPVMLTREHGFTYAAASAGAFSINSAVAATHKDAVVTGSQLLLESRIDYESAARASSGGVKAFKNATSHVVENMLSSFQSRLEIDLLWGGNSTTNAGIFRVGSQVTDSGTTQVYAVHSGTWAPAIMAGLENALVDIYDDDGAGGIPSSLLTTAGATTVSAVDFANKRVTFTGTEAELDLLTAPTATACYAFFTGSYGAQMVGLVEIAQNTGTLFGVAGGTYGLWQGNSYAVGSTELTWDKLIAGLDGPAGRGCDEDITVYLNPWTWTNVMTDLASQRQYDGSYSRKRLEQGSMGLVFAGQTGNITVKSTGYMKEAVALAFPTKSIMRLGAVDITFNTPGMEKDQFFYHLPNNAGLGFRAYANQAIFTPRPAFCNLYTGISNT